MEDEIKTWLSDIQQAIEEIDVFLPENTDFQDFKKDLKTKRAIEIIGEAVNRILKIKADFPIENARKIVDTRNRIIHGYDTVSEEIIWAIVERDLPALKKDIKRLLD